MDSNTLFVWLCDTEIVFSTKRAKSGMHSKQLLHSQQIYWRWNEAKQNQTENEWVEEKKTAHKHTHIPEIEWINKKFDVNKHETHE